MDSVCKNQLIIKLKLNEYFGYMVSFNILYRYFRLDGPAIIYQHGSKEWMVNSRMHRDDGPASINVCGRKEWWVNDKLVNETVYG